MALFRRESDRKRAPLTRLTCLFVDILFILFAPWVVFYKYVRYMFAHATKSRKMSVAKQLQTYQA